MLQLLRIEWMKVKYYRTFWILLGISIVCIPGLNYTIYNLTENSFPKMQGKSILGSPFGFPDVWQTVSWNSSMLFLIPAILIITLTTNEFVYKTHRQNVIDGWSRRQFIAVKLVEVLLISLLCTLVVAGTALVFGTIVNKVPAGVSIWRESRFVFFFFIQALSYLLIAFLLSMLIKRAGLVMGIWLVYMLIENIVVGIFRHRFKVTAVDYLPEEVTDRLIPQPYLKAILSPEGAANWESHVPIYLLVAAFYILLYCLLTSRRFLRTDL